MSQQTCKTCKFCREEKGDPMQGVGKMVYNCFRYPPQANSAPVGAPGGGMGLINMTTTPQILPERAACGEYQPKVTLS